MADNNSPISRFASRVLIVVGIIIVFYLIFFLFYKIPEILLLIFTSILFAVLLDGITEILSKWTRIPRKWSLLIIVLLFVGVSVLGVILLGVPIVSQFSKLGQQLPQAINNIIAALKNTALGKTLFQSLPNFEDIIPSSNTTIKLISGTFSSAIEIAGDILIVFLLGIYFASNPSMYIDNIIILLPQDKRERAHEIVHKLGHALRYFLIGRVIIMISISILTTIALWVIGMPLALPLGLLTGILSFVPYIGAIIPFFPVVIIAMGVSSTLTIYSAIVYTALHNIEGYVLTPLIQEQVVSIPPALLIIAQILMFVLFGTLGVLIATPLAIAIVIIIQMVYVEDILKEKVKIMGE